MGQSEHHSSFASRYFKLDYVQPALKTGNAYFKDRPILTTFLTIFFAFSMLPLLAYLGTFALASASFFFIALAVAFIASFALFLSLSAILVSILLGAFFVSALFTSMIVSAYLLLRLFALVQENGVSGVAAWAHEIKLHILNIYRRNSAYGYRTQARDNQSNTNESVVVVHEPEIRSSEYHDEGDDAKVEPA